MGEDPFAPGVAAWAWFGDLLPQRLVRGAAAERAQHWDSSSSVLGPNVSATCVGSIKCRRLTTSSVSYGSGGPNTSRFNHPCLMHKNYASWYFCDGC